MPQAKDITAPGLSITLAQPISHIYTPGSIISGHVHLCPTEDISTSTLTIKFYGRAKVKIRQSHGEGESIWRSRANLFCIETPLLSSPVGFKAEAGERWERPFSITCPEQADEASLRDTKGSRRVKRSTAFKRSKDGNFLDFENFKLAGAERGQSIGQRDLSGDMTMNTSLAIPEQGLLPPAMNYYHGMFGRKAYGFVEYVLAATLTETNTENKRNILGIKTGPKKHVTTKIIDFRAGGFQKVLRQPDMGLVEESRSAVLKMGKGRLATSTSNLATTMAQTQLLDDNNPVKTASSKPALFSRLSLTSSITTSSSSSYSTSTLSNLPLTITTSHATTLQVHHPDPIPFKVRIAPDSTFYPPSLLTNTNTSTSTSTPLPSLLLKTFTLHLICTTRIRGAGPFADHFDKKTVAIPLAKNAPINHLLFSPHHSTSLANPPDDYSSSSSFHNALPHPSSPSIQDTEIDLGTLANLHLPRGSVQIGKIHEPTLVPTFKTYNIMREFGLKWCIEFEIGDGSFGAANNNKIGKRRRIEKVEGKVPAGGIRVVGVADSIRDGLALGVVDVVGEDEDEDVSEEGGVEEKEGKSKGVGRWILKGKSKGQKARVEVRKEEYEG